MRDRRRIAGRSDGSMLGIRDADQRQDQKRDDQVDDDEAEVASHQVLREMRPSVLV